LHIAQPVAALGELAFIDDVDTGLALLRNDSGDILGNARVVAGREAFVR
jgi:hypothetical protein